MARLQCDGQEMVAVHKDLMYDSTLLIAKHLVRAKVCQSSYHPHLIRADTETTGTYVSLELGQAIVPLFGVLLRSVRSWHISILYAGKFGDSESNMEAHLNTAVVRPCFECDRSYDAWHESVMSFRKFEHSREGAVDSVDLAPSELEDATLLTWNDTDRRRFPTAAEAVQHYWRRDHDRLDEMFHETRLEPIWISER